MVFLWWFSARIRPTSPSRRIPQRSPDFRRVHDICMTKNLPEGDDDLGNRCFIASGALRLFLDPTSMLQDATMPCSRVGRMQDKGRMRAEVTFRDPISQGASRIFLDHH